MKILNCPLLAIGLGLAAAIAAHGAVQGAQAPEAPPPAPPQPAAKKPAEPAALIVPGSTAKAGEDAPLSSDPLVASVELLEREFRDAMAAWSEKMRATDNNEEARKELLKVRPTPDSYVPRFRSIAQTNPKTAAAARALVWIFNNVREPSERIDCVLTIVKDHAKEDSLGDFASSLARFPASEAVPALETLLQDNPHVQVRGRACLALADWHMDPPNRAKDAAVPPEARKRAEALYERAAKDFGEVAYRRSTIGQVAQSNLFELRNLAMGMVAPEIAGTDLDGAEFKLSEYRGKVVLLDFWGHW